MASNHVYLGTKGQVIAIDRATGTTLWRSRLTSNITGSRFVSLLIDGSRLFAHTGGQLFCLDAATGQTLWQNRLDGMGYDIATMAIDGTSTSTVAAAAALREQAARTSAAIG